MQGYLPVEALVLDVEAWGLGGNAAREIQETYQKREELFTNQRRKVQKPKEHETSYAMHKGVSKFDTFVFFYPQIDLKTFTNWEDSPEKMMMDMMGNPNAPRKEER